MVGAFLGWMLALLTIILGSFIGSIIGLFLILFRGRNLQHKLAFGTLLGIAAVLVLFFGLPFIAWYTAIAR
jgi:leader peptidase (prepilin peptidase)/N-methyltransferase